MEDNPLEFTVPLGSHRFVTRETWDNVIVPMAVEHMAKGTAPLRRIKVWAPCDRAVYEIIYGLGYGAEEILERQSLMLIAAEGGKDEQGKV